jgi:hypothetical protein
MKLRGGEFSTGTTGNFQPELTVQPEMERGRSPLVSIPLFGRGFSRHRYDHQAIPEQGCVAQSPLPFRPARSL